MNRASAAAGAAPRRLLVVCHGFPPYYGGAEMVAYYLAREAARSGEFGVRVLTSDIGGRLPAAEALHGLDVVRVRARKRAWTRHTAPELLAFLLAGRRRLPDLVADWQPDYVLAHFAVPAGELARIVKRRYGVPYATVLHGSDVPGYQPQRFGLVYPLLKPIVRRVWRQADRVIAVSASLADLAGRTWPGGNIAVIGNGVDTEVFHPADSLSVKASDAPVIAVTVAQLIERKGIQHLLDALAGLAAGVRARLRVHVYGTGPYEAALRAKAAELRLEPVVDFRRLCPHDQLPGVLRQADFFVLPSLQEGLPLALLEAMASGLAVIGTRVGGIPAVLRDRDNGLLVPAADSAALRQALGALTTAAELRRSCGQAARRTAEQYSWARVWAQYRATLRLGRSDAARDCGVHLAS